MKNRDDVRTQRSRSPQRKARLVCAMFAIFALLSCVTPASAAGRPITVADLLALQDFRVPYTQSLEFFSALQRQNVPSKLIVFPDEGHWVLKPQNSTLWYKEVMGWLARYLPSEPGSEKSPQ